MSWSLQPCCASRPGPHRTSDLVVGEATRRCLADLPGTDLRAFARCIPWAGSMRALRTTPGERLASVDTVAFLDASAGRSAAVRHDHIVVDRPTGARA